MAGDGLISCWRDSSTFLYLVVLVAVLGPLQFGYHLAELNAPQDVLTCTTKDASSPSLLLDRWLFSIRPGENSTEVASPWDCIPMNEAAFATVSSVFTIGGFVGAVSAGPFSSSRGRLLAMRITGVVFILGAVVETLAQSVGLLAFGRLVSGLGAGASTVIVPLYISEVSPPKGRGTFGVMTQVFINIGILTSQTLGLFWSRGSMWRWILGSGGIFAAVQTAGLLCVPESPAWLAARGNGAKGRQILQKLRSREYVSVEETAAWTLDEDGAEEEGLLAEAPADAGMNATAQPQHVGFLQVVKDPLYRPAIIAVVGIMFAQQLAGINSVIMYSVSLLHDLLPTSSALLTVLISAVNLITTVCCSPLPDRLGRKTCLVASLIGQGSSSLVLALSIVYGIKTLSAVAVFAFVGFFAVGLGPVPFMMASEMVGQEAVGATQSWCLAANYVATFLVAQFFPIVNSALNHAFGGAGWVYFIFAAMAAASVVFVIAMVPETKGKGSIDEVWGRTRRLD